MKTQEPYTLEDYQEAINRAPKPWIFKSPVIRMLLRNKESSRFLFVNQLSSVYDVAFTDITIHKVRRGYVNSSGETTIFWDWEFKINNTVLFWTEILDCDFDPNFPGNSLRLPPIKNLNLG